MPKLDYYDYLTFAALVVILVAAMVVMILFLGLPGRIARKRKHPEADAIYVMGWLGFLGGVPWIQAFIWAFKPTDVVDIRRFPREEGKALAKEFAEDAGSAAKTPAGEKPDSLTKNSEGQNSETDQTKPESDQGN